MNRSLSLVCMLASGLGMSAFAQTGAAATTDPAAGAPVAASATATGATKIAIIMFQPAVIRTNEGQRDISEVQKKFEPKQTQLKALNDEIESLKKQLQASGDKLSEPERATRLKSIDDKQKSLQRQAEDAQNDYQSAMGETYNQLAQKVDEVLVAYAQQNGFSVVIDASAQQSPVIWAAPTTDITQAIITAYNAKSGVPAPANVPSAPAPAAHTAPRAPAPTTTH
jgi:outer membrane protein